MFAIAKPHGPGTHVATPIHTVQLSATEGTRDTYISTNLPKVGTYVCRQWEQVRRS